MAFFTNYMFQDLQILPIFLSALLSSFLTLLGLYFFSLFFIKRKLGKQIDLAGGIVKKRLEEGVLEAAREVLPDFREEVRQGFTEALSRALSGEIIPQTARQLAKNSQGLVEQGLSFLLGRSDPSTKEEEPKDSQSKEKENEKKV